MSGAGSTWNAATASGLTVGGSGSAALNVSNGGVVNADNIVIGTGAGGTVSITNGGAVNCTNGTAGLGAGSGTGTVTVDGAGSTWTNSGPFIVGSSASATLDVTNGGTVTQYSYRNDPAYIGQGSLATVDGAGSTWNSNGTLNVGGGTNGSGTLYGTNGSGVLYVRNGGAVNSGGGSVTYGAATVDGVGVNGVSSTWNNGSGTLNVGGGYSGTLNITNGGIVSSSGGSITNATVTVSGAGGNGASSTWNSGTLTVGGGYGSGMLNIFNGGAVNSSNGSITWGVAKVDGAGSTWNNSGTPLSVYDPYGVYGSATLNITNGGSVSSSGGSITHGTATVDGTGVNGPSMWTNSSDLYVGGAYGSGTLYITNGGAVSMSPLNINNGFIGNNGSTGAVTVDGAGSKWTNIHDVFVGYAGGGTLNITNGGTVTNDNGIVGWSGSTGTATVSGNSTWNNTHELVVGWSGSGTLNITTGGVVNCLNPTGGWIGYSGATGTVTVDGANSELNIGSGDTFLGRMGSSGTLSITNGGVVTSGGDSYIGHGGDNGAGTGTVTVDGAHSTWTNSNTLSVGYANGYSGNGTLTITNGGAVSSSSGYVGIGSGSTGMVTVDGAGSTWNNGSTIYAGAGGSGTLNITNGGTVISDYGVVGAFGSSSATATVDGRGSTWTTYTPGAGGGGELNAGDGGTGTLNITNGGAASSGNGFIGRGAGSTGTATVSDAGQWNTNGYDMDVGFYGGSGTLNITNGGTVTSGNGHIGFSSGYTGGPTPGEVTVDGKGSTWTNSGNLYVADGGSGTLNITNGGQVNVASTLTLWETNSLVTVNGGLLSVGGLSGGGQILISDPAGGAALTVGSATDSTFAGTIADSSGGPGSLLKIGIGTLTLGGANSYSGHTTISEGVLAMGADNSLSPLSDLVLHDGTSLATNGYSQTVGTGTLTILGDATIDMGSPGSILKFADSSVEAWTGTLTILDWDGFLTGGGADELFFGSSASALTLSQLSEIIFENPDGLTGDYEATILATGEVVPVPVPEPSTFVLLGIGAISLLAYAWRRQRKAS